MDIESPHVLVVDDSRVDSLVASRIFSYFNIQVTIMEGAMQALEFLDEEHDVDLIFTDYRMPYMAGYDLLREVKESPRLRHIPVVITCVDIIPERIIRCLNGGAEEYIIKPLKIADMPRILSYI